MKLGKNCLAPVFLQHKRSCRAHRIQRFEQLSSALQEESSSLEPSYEAMSQNDNAEDAIIRGG